MDVARAYKVGSITKEEKKDSRNLIMRGGPWNDNEKSGLIEYNATDVIVSIPLLRAMLAEILRAVPGKSAQANLEYALIRGRYMGALAQEQWHGIPWDVPLPKSVDLDIKIDRYIHWTCFVITSAIYLNSMLMFASRFSCSGDRYSIIFATCIVLLTACI